MNSKGLGLGLLMLGAVSSTQAQINNFPQQDKNTQTNQELFQEFNNKNGINVYIEELEQLIQHMKCTVPNQKQKEAFNDAVKNLTSKIFSTCLGGQDEAQKVIDEVNKYLLYKYELDALGENEVFKLCL